MLVLVDELVLVELDVLDDVLVVEVEVLVVDVDVLVLVVTAA